MRLLAVCILVLMAAGLFAKNRAEESGRPIYLKAKYKGTKRWNTQKMEPYSGTLNVEIDDTIALISTQYSERPDTFIFKGISNNHFSYGKKNHFLYKYFWISPDTINVQIGVPMEQNYFYKLDTIYAIKNHKKIDCQKCHGTGRVIPDPRSSHPDICVGICPVCGGKGTF